MYRLILWKNDNNNIVYYICFEDSDPCGYLDDKYNLILYNDGYDDKFKVDIEEIDEIDLKSGVINIYFPNLLTIHLKEFNDDILHFIENHDTIIELIFVGCHISDIVINLINKLNLISVYFGNCIIDDSFYKFNKFIKYIRFYDTNISDDMIEVCKYVHYDTLFIGNISTLVSHLINKYAQEDNMININNVKI